MPLIDVDRLKSSGQKFASGFTTGQKVLSILGVAGLGIALFFFTRMSATTDYAPLFSGLSAKDAGSITTQLDSQGEAYKLSDGGATILVPKADVYKVRIAMSAKGLPANSDSYALLDNQGITTSEFTQQVNYQRATQEELAKTIEEINGVNGATVTLSLPSTDPFVDASEKKAKASVQIDSGSTQLTNSQVQSIVHLVAASVKDLNPSDISVTDTQGTLLYSGDSTGAFASQQNLSQKLAYQAIVQKNVSDLVDKTLGPGHAAVTVAADLDFSQGTKETTKQTPVLDKNGNPIPLSSSKDNTQYGGNGGNSTGVLGVNTPATTTATTIAGGFQEDKGAQNNAVNQETSKTSTPDYTVKNLSVSVVLDKTKVAPADLAAWKSQIGAAAGIQNPRGDTLVVNTMAMDKDVQKIAQDQFTARTTPATPSSPLDLMGIVRYVVTLLIVGLALFIAWRSVKKGQLALAPVRVPLDLAALESGSRTVTGEHSAELAAARAADALPMPETRSLEPARSPIELEVTELIESQPEDVAQTLRSWLADRRS